MSRSVAPALVALLSACARTQPPPNLDALRDAAFSDLRCPDALPASKPSQPPPDGMKAVALVGQTAYGLSSGGRLWTWDGKGPARVFDPARFVALARDGSVAVTHAREGEEGTRLEVRALPSNQPLDQVVLRDGGFPLAVSSTRAVLDVGLPQLKCNGEDRDDDLCEGTIAWQPPTHELAAWTFPSGATERVPLSACKQVSLAARGGSFACLNEDEDWISWGPPILLAPEWRPPPDPHNESLPLHWQVRESWLQVTSLRLSPSDDAVYVTYRAINIFIADRGLPGHRGWRLERWTRDPARPGEGKFARLAESPDSLCAKVLAASSDGGLVVLGGSQQALTVRRAPRYAPEPLAVPRANDAVVSADGARILTGHGDGRFRLWDARSLALVAESPPPPTLPPFSD
jgi:hypothetical protein